MQLWIRKIKVFFLATALRILNYEGMNIEIKLYMYRGNLKGYMKSQSTWGYIECVLMRLGPTIN